MTVLGRFYHHHKEIRRLLAKTLADKVPTLADVAESTENDTTIWIWLIYRTVMGITSPEDSLQSLGFNDEYIIKFTTQRVERGESWRRSTVRYQESWLYISLSVDLRRYIPLLSTGGHDKAFPPHSSAKLWSDNVAIITTIPLKQAVSRAPCTKGVSDSTAIERYQASECLSLRTTLQIYQEFLSCKLKQKVREQEVQRF